MKKIVFLLAGFMFLLVGLKAESQELCILSNRTGGAQDGSIVYLEGVKEVKKKLVEATENDKKNIRSFSFLAGQTVPFSFSGPGHYLINVVGEKNAYVFYIAHRNARVELFKTKVAVSHKFDVPDWELKGSSLSNIYKNYVVRD
ncbi:hypothetical protein KAW80_02355 [Candidatus Babeliales bacterium]|nr:hypothetical protein [Candidatus Babeliales bacterium]